MKKFITLISAVLVLGTLATASTGFVSQEEVNHNCDPLEQLMGMCRSSQPFSFEN